jgi:hypothetical protein
VPPPANWVCLYNRPHWGPGPLALPVLTREIGFVLSGLFPRAIRRKSLSAQHLSSKWLLSKLGLFRTIGSPTHSGLAPTGSRLLALFGAAGRFVVTP